MRLHNIGDHYEPLIPAVCIIAWVMIAAACLVFCERIVK